MSNTDFTIRYKAVHPGTEFTRIFFYDNIRSALERQASDAAGYSENNARNRIYITDANVAQLESVKDFLETEKKRGIPVCILKAGEEYKTFDALLPILKTALDYNLSRSSVFIGIGGGVVCDMSAFAASVFKRGARTELVPTTLLAMVDAAIGGKTGCDFGNYKNMLGSFYPAQKIHIAADVTRSLNEREFNSGLAEILKTALLYDSTLFRLLRDCTNLILNRDADIIRRITERCARLKARVVQKDLTECGIRMHLNLGHSFGHALETIAGLGSGSHGEAVAWGIGRAAALSEKLGLSPASYKNEVFDVLTSYGWCTAALHPAVQNIQNPADALIEAMRRDKKNTNGAIRLILQRGINSTLIREIDDVYIRTVL